MTPIPAAPTRSRLAVSVLAVAVPIVLLLSGCVADKSSAAPPSSTPRPTRTAEPAVTLAPLRGTTVDVGSLDTPSLAAKIDNHSDARPQIGLERTDIVFEELVEGGLTRYVAVWQSDVPDLVGPVRSIRPMDPDIIAPLGGIVAYSGGQERFMEMMESTAVVNAVFDYDEAGLFYRIEEKDSPHDVVVKATELISQHADLAPPRQQFEYSASAADSSAMVGGSPTGTIDARFSDSRWPSWTWSAADTAYLRAQEGEPDFDSAGNQLRSTNVVVLRVDIDWTYGEVPKTTLVGSGEAWISTGGKSTHATWVKGAQDAAIRLLDDNGVVIRLAPGNTWIELVPIDEGSVELLP
ncbi:DUF3048 domain-containing protein [Leifsonia sp. A12D58]|uniref:DUF3048 domain-containing protein n=1 Tax=Leifsonia sp. A12D58 TaxID=3397674 RepID=UPI0039DF50FA